MIETLLHLCVPNDEVTRVLRWLRPFDRAVSDAGWEAFDVPMIANPPTPCTHVLVSASTIEHDDIVAGLARWLRRDDDGSWIAVETRVDDWSVRKSGGRIWHHVPTPHGDIVVVETHPWHD